MMQTSHGSRTTRGSIADDPDRIHDVAIVGGGPIGIELAIRLRAAGVQTIQLEAGPIGATIAWWAPETTFFSSPERIAIAGVPIPSVDQGKATRESYLAYLRAVVQQFDVPIATHRRVVDVARLDDGPAPAAIDPDEPARFRLTHVRARHGVGGPDEARRGPGASQDGDAAEGGARSILARRVVLAIGNMHQPRRIDVPGEDLPHVSHFAAEPHESFGERVLVVGGKNSAVETALRLYRAGVDVAISYRGDAFDTKRVKYWLRPEIEWLIGKGRIGWYPGTVPVAIESEAVVLGPSTGPQDGGATTRVPATRVFLMTGYVQDGSLFDRLGVERDGATQAPGFDRATMETSVPGIFVAGTACGGSQERAKFYIENTHVHVDRIAARLTGRTDAAIADPDFSALEES